MEILQRNPSMLTIIGILLVCSICFIPYVNSISCYRCDALDRKVSDCPGWMRRPIDSVLDLHDKGGLYTHCVDVRLANGTVLHQDVVPTLPTCKPSFIQTWHDILVKRYDMEVIIICCKWNKCNGHEDPTVRGAFGTKHGGNTSIPAGPTVRAALGTKHGGNNSIPSEPTVRSPFGTKHGENTSIPAGPTVRAALGTKHGRNISIPSGPAIRAAFGTKHGGNNNILVLSLPILLITVITW